MKRSQPPELRTAVRRLAWQFTALMLVVVVILGAFVFAIVSQSAAEANAKALFDATHIDSPQDAPMGTWVAVVHNGSTTTSRGPIAGLPDVEALKLAASTQADVRTTVTSEGRTFDVLSVARPNGEVQVARDQHETREELDRLLWALCVAGGIAAVCSAIGSTWMARRAIRPLADALELQRRFVSDASHELRTPLTLLSTRAQLARRRLVGVEAGDAHSKTLDDLTLVVDDAQRLTGILEDLLIAADTRSMPAHTVVDVATAAREAISASAVSASKRSVQIHSEGVQSGATVRASQAAIDRLFLALLDNAIDHARTSIDVMVSVKGKIVTARIRDDGPGFTELSKQRAFERFGTTRNEQSDADAPRHYGIGLALVAEIVSRAGGSVSIEDTPAGACIRVDLPFAP